MGWLPHRTGLRRYIGPKRLAMLVLFVGLLGLAWYLRREGWLRPDVLDPILRVHPLRSMAVFLVLYGLSVLSPLPTLPFNLAAGLFWGPWMGGLLATCGSWLGAVAAFVVSRVLFGQVLARQFDSRLVTRMQCEFDAKGWRFIAFARIVPIFPTGPFNYLLGLTSIGPATFLWTTFVFTLPPSLLFATIGHSLGSFVLEGAVADLVRLMVAVISAIFLPILVHYAYGFYREIHREAEDGGGGGPSVPE